MKRRQQKETPGSLPVLRVNDRIISAEEIHREARNHRASGVGQAREQAARALVVRELVLAEAGRQGIDSSDRASGETPEDAQIRKLIERNIELPAPAESECLRYYHANPDAMRADDQHEVSHILIPAPSGDAEIRAAARDKAVDLLQTLRAKPARFAELAREFSHCPSAAEGGHLGLIGRGQTVPEFEAALSRLPVGEVPDYPLETRYGFHVVMIHQRRSGGPLSFESCRQKIAGYLRENARRQAIREFIASLPEHHRVQGIDLQAGAGTPAR